MFKYVSKSTKLLFVFPMLCEVLEIKVKMNFRSNDVTVVYLFT